MIPPPPSSPPPEAAAGVGGQSSNMKEEKDSFFDDDDAKSTASKDEDSMGGDGDYDDINDDSLSGSGSSGRNNHTSTAGKESYREGLAKEETKAIKRLKCGLVFFLLIVAAAIAAVVYIYTDNVQQSEFESDFIEQATKLVEGFSSDSYQKMQALESLSKALNLHATASSSSSDNNTTKTTTKTWPFVTIPNSHDFFQPFLSLANAASIRIQPIVEARQRIQWYQHVSSTQDWIDHDLQKRGIVSSTGSGRSLQTEEEEDDDSTTSSSSSSSFTTIDINEENYRVSPYIKNYVGVDTSPNYWVPWWQYAPVIKNKWFINFNLLADGEFMRDFEILKTTKKAIIAKTVSYKPGLDFQSTRDLNFLQELLQAGGYGQYESGEPIGFIHYPVFGSSSSDHHDDDNDDNENVVAVITATVYWKTYFQNILPTTTTGIICVVENDIQTFTYRIDGNEAKFLGMEDLHDINYNQYEITSNYKSFESDFASSTNTTTTTTSTTTTTNTGQRYTGVSVDETRLAYRIRVYPSKEFQEPFDTNEPWMYAFVAGAIMLLAVFFFLIYDWYVERRQNKVSNVAVNANAIVSSLFPASVKDKLLNQQQQDKRGSNNNNNNNNNNSNAFKTGNNPMTRMSQALTGGGKQQQDVNIADYDDEDDDDGQQDTFGGVRSSRNIGYESAPIADFFPSATVLFMDIAGFTAWSSSREPSQVFILLETIYRSFDKIASRRGVFKVETIGDCYVAVCGLPCSIDCSCLLRLTVMEVLF